jgi:iron complex outermembrane receptor protein
VNPKGEANSGYTKDSGIDLNKYYVAYAKDFGSSSFNVTVYKYQDLYDNTSNPQDLDANPDTANVYVTHSNQDLQQTGLKSEFTTTNESFASLLGVEFGKRDYESNSETLANYTAYNSRTRVDENYYDGEKTYTNSKERVEALYGELKYNVTPQFTTVINGRYNILTKEYITEKYDYNGTIWSDITTTESRTFRNTAYRAGATYNISKAIDLFANVSTGFQNPDADDMAINPALKEQTSINYEVGARGVVSVIDTDDLTYEGSIYQLDNKDILGPQDGTYAFSSPIDNIGDSRSRGLELSLRSDASKMFSFTLAYTFLDAKYTKHNLHAITLQDRSTIYYDIVGKEIPRVSKHTLDLFVNYNVTNELKLITELYAKSSYYADEVNLVKFDGYELVNLQARYNTKLFGSALELYVKVDNAFDNQYYRSVFMHSDKRGILGLDPEDGSITVDPGRVYYAGVKYTF